MMEKWKFKLIIVVLYFRKGSLLVDIKLGTELNISQSLHAVFNSDTS